ncbi:MAG TPA: response regulator [Draconibacterium sp.]|nr:response regulator [Draconibacterium sp.]
MKRILVAEDNKLILETVALNLAREGYEVLKAMDGKECLKIVREKEIDLIITDIYMPNINGLEVISTLKEEQINIPVLVLSAAGAEDNVSKAFELGADDFMIKPFSLMELNFRVKKLLDKKN